MLLDPSPTSLSQENTEHHPAHDGEIKWQMTMKALTPLTGTPGQKQSLQVLGVKGKALVMQKAQCALSLGNILLYFTSSKDLLCQLPS